MSERKDRCFAPLPGSRHSIAMERRLLDYYDLGDVIGEGGFGSVCAGTSRQNGQTVSSIHTQINVLLCYNWNVDMAIQCLIYVCMWVDYSNT